MSFTYGFPAANSYPSPPLPPIEKCIGVRSRHDASACTAREMQTGRERGLGGWGGLGGREENLFFDVGYVRRRLVCSLKNIGEGGGGGVKGSKKV